jgi:hypothetical protein
VWWLHFSFHEFFEVYFVILEQLVVLEVFHQWSVFGPSLHAQTDEVSRVFTDVAWKSHCSSENSFVELTTVHLATPIAIAEGSLAYQHLKKQRPNAPNIHCLAMGNSSNHFGT